MDERVTPADAQTVSRSDAFASETEGSTKRWGLVALGFLAAGVLGFVLLQVLAPDPGQVPRQVNAPLVQVEPVAVITGSLPVIGNGPVRPRADVVLVAQVSGEIVEISETLVTGGSFTKGETLARIDPRPYQAALDQAEADREARRADLAFAERQLQRDQELAQSGAASERRRDETLNQRDRARAQIAGLDALISARAIDLERTAIVAPFDGRVLTDRIDVGSVVRPGVELARIYASDIFEIVVPFSDREAALIPGIWDTDRRQTPTAIAKLPYRGNIYTWDGYVDRVEAGIDPDTRTIDVVVRIPNPTRPGQPANESDRDTLVEAPPLLIGTYAGVEIEGTVLSYVLIPRIALREGNTVWIVRADNTLQILSVEVAQNQGNRMAVQSPDLKTGDQLVISDLPFATNGLAVRVADVTGTAQ